MNRLFGKFACEREEEGMLFSCAYGRDTRKIDFVFCRREASCL